MCLGNLTEVELREVWTTEDRDFTPWLEQHISLLADKLKLDLEVEARESPVGRFKADILCKDRSDNSWVLIENQFGTTDHKHLGQLVTYAAGLGAKTIVWIAEGFNEEHRAALDWLNRETTNDIRFFALKIKLFKIEGSSSAPYFEIVCSPNEFSRDVGAARRRAETNTSRMYLAFWDEFRTAFPPSHKIVLPRDIDTGTMIIAFLRAGVQLRVMLNTRGNQIAVQLYLLGANAGAYFRELEDSRPEIDDELGFSPVWGEQGSNTNARGIIRRNPDCPLGDRNRWPTYCNWLIESLVSFDRVFRPKVVALDPANFPDPAADDHE